MCLSAIHWAQIQKVIFGASIGDATAAGFSQLAVSARQLAQMGGSKLIVETGLCTEECRSLFDRRQGPRPASY
jgi:tRNA(Arg) A34 adenosine deaminase TadA